ncbi:MAG: DUF6062 family protein [Lachnospiraceae bacterium]|nr:DUF6062 family protein [Lachnospiraceae bacterium]
MKERLYTMELTDAVRAGDECMFCWLNRKLEQENLEFVLGSSYMESDIREKTSEKGFCRHHVKLMYDYGNSLGNAWIMKSWLEQKNRELKAQSAQNSAEKKSAGKPGWFSKLRNGSSGAGNGFGGNGIQESCYICERMQTVSDRMLDTFVHMLRTDAAFEEQLMQTKGFCFPHYQAILAVCESKLKPEEQSRWIPRLNTLMQENLDRVQADINWLIEKYDYRNQDADWRQSKDALPRTMQKLTGRMV